MRVPRIIAAAAAFVLLVSILQVVSLALLASWGLSAPARELGSALLGWLLASIVAWWAWRRGLKDWLRS
jgi:hypothetical protein